jgi:26S proteasome regulatory subunit N7
LLSVICWTFFFEFCRKSKEEKLAHFDAKIQENREKFGDVEVFEVQREKADFLGKSYDKDNFLHSLSQIDSKKLSTSQKIDLSMSKIRFGLSIQDFQLIKSEMTVAKTLNEKGGDWDHRNRLRIYEGLFEIMNGELSKACTLFVDSIATFTCTEIMPYSKFVWYTILLSMLSLDRPQLKKLIIDSPDIKSYIHDVPFAHSILHSFYDGQYRLFFQSLLSTIDLMKLDRFWSKHTKMYMKKLKGNAYSQFLVSYKSVSLTSMATSFGISRDYLDEDLSEYITNGVIHAKIDAVNDMIETNRPDLKDELYMKVLKNGDSLLNKIQGISRIVSV